MTNIENKRMSMSSPSYGLIAAAIVVVALVLFTMYFVFSGKNAGEAEEKLRTEILALQTDQESNSEKIASLSPDVLQLKQDVEALRQEYLDALKQIEEIGLELEQMSPENVKAIIRQEVGYGKEELDGLFLKVDALVGKIEAIEKRLAAKPKAAAAPASPNSANGSSNSPSAAAVPAVPRPAAQTPPFDVIGVESRGSEFFLAVAPNTAKSLSEIKLYREQDTVVGAWKLTRIDMDKAVFSVHGRDVTVAIN